MKIHPPPKFFFPPEEFKSRFEQAVRKNKKSVNLKIIKSKEQEKKEIEEKQAKLRDLGAMK